MGKITVLHDWAGSLSVCPTGCLGIDFFCESVLLVISYWIWASHLVGMSSPGQCQENATMWRLTGLIKFRMKHSFYQSIFSYLSQDQTQPIITFSLTPAVPSVCYFQNQECLAQIIIDREAREIMYLVASVHPSVCPSVRLSMGTLTAEPFDLRPWLGARLCRVQ